MTLSDEGDPGCTALSKIAMNHLQKELSEWQMSPPFGFKHNVTDNLQRYLGAVEFVEFKERLQHSHQYWMARIEAPILQLKQKGPSTSSHVPQLFHNSIRVLCNANTSKGFNPSKDASSPEIHLRTGEITGLIGGLSPSSHSILAFFAGRLHGHIRLLLLEQWKNKDEDVQVYESLSEGVSYDKMLKKSKYCLCPSGYEAASPRVVEAIYAECVPMLISDHYVPPFSDILNWKSFSVQIHVKDIANIKRILRGISQTQYLRMHKRVKQVQKHFVVNGPPKSVVPRYIFLCLFVPEAIYLACTCITVVGSWFCLENTHSNSAPISP
ncbi:hypothetical protein GIB67_027451 [Kingdonia uniflora]|uniref:Exostosin GT47 domain-containing protein n=1 Tax=Kingdonia uniflora TaxID=39325 RepID=A0A7J7MFP0_9MAGN|nr:hypothetical protein GIB67_027451 [Kingdonia uniflora]